MAVAVVLYILVRWSKNEPAVNIGSLLAGAFVIGFIALLDHGRASEIAKGFAWLFLVVVLYHFVPAMTAAMKAAGAATKSNVQTTLQ